MHSIPAVYTHRCWLQLLRSTVTDIDSEFEVSSLPGPNIMTNLAGTLVEKLCYVTMKTTQIYFPTLLFNNYTSYLPEPTR